MKREIGQTGITVTAIGLGGMPLSIAGRPDEEQAFKVIEAFAELGGNFIDTANTYCIDNLEIGHNERLIRKVLGRLGLSETVTVATKGGLTRPEGRWEVNGHPEFLRKSCEKSLKDLNCDAITLYQLHAVDPAVSFLDSLEALFKLKEEGKIKHIGLSNLSHQQLESAVQSVDIVSVQNRCNIFDQKDFKNGLINYCEGKGLTYLPYSPVGGHQGHVRTAAHPTVLRLAKKYGESPYCIALAWLLQKGENILPIPGASRTESVRDSQRALNVSLDPQDIELIDQIPNA